MNRRDEKGYSTNRINPLLAKCFRCGYEWIPRNEKIRTCAKCRSPYWDKARNSKEHSKMRIWALGIIQNAKYKGYIGKPKNQKCVDCGKKATDWEHRNYSRPLIVEPICRSCNLRRGSSLNFNPKSCPRCKARLDAKKVAGKADSVKSENKN